MVLLLSDTHGSYAAVHTVIRREDAHGSIEAVIHTGDVLHATRTWHDGHTPADLAALLKALSCPVVYVRGNTDTDADCVALGLATLPERTVVTFGGVRIAAQHGHRAGEAAQRAWARSEGADILVTGHTHVKRLDRVCGLVVLNPGSTTNPRDHVASYARLDGLTVSLLSVADGTLLQTLRLSGGGC